MQPSALPQAALVRPQPRLSRHSAIVPGVLLATLLALLSFLAARWLSGIAPAFGPIPVSPIVVAIVLGIAIRNTASHDERFEPGLQFSQCRILQLGIVLLGIRLSLGEFAAIGLGSIPLIVICIGTALLFINLLGRALGLSPQLATLIAAGTSICGATAIVATAPIISARNHEVSYAIACITLFGVIATLAYPLTANWLFAGDAQQVGLFLGTAVHDTAQVVGAGMIYQNLFGTEVALDVATVTKLIRNLAMLIVIPALSITFQRKYHTGGERPHWHKLVPLFIVGFALMSLLRTVGDLGVTPFGVLTNAQWELVITLGKRGAEICLLVAMAAVGLNTSLAGLKSVGFKPLGLGLAAAALVGVVSSSLIRIFY
jgi:uncharacterized integral membrane protein (TIGR00698 family)